MFLDKTQRNSLANSTPVYKTEIFWESAMTQWTTNILVLVCSEAYKQDKIRV